MTNAISGLDRTQTDNGGREAIELTKPYRARIAVTGVAPLLFHSLEQARWWTARPSYGNAGLPTQRCEARRAPEPEDC